MKFVVLALLVTLAFAQTGGPTRAPPTPCQMCDFIIGQALHHVHGRGVDNEGRLLMALVEECEFLRRHGNDAVNKCVNFVSTNIQTIFTDVKAHKQVKDICTDLKQSIWNWAYPCPSHPCQMCNFIIGQAIHHVGTRVGNEAQLMMALVKECESLSRQGNDVVNQCVNFVSANIQTIFTEVQANKRASEICTDLKQC